MWNRILQEFFPARCVLCELGLPATATRDLCGHCAAVLPWNAGGCPRCALPATAAGSPEHAPASPLSGDTVPFAQQPCAECRRIPPAFRFALAPLRYESHAAGWIRRLKDDMGFVEGRLLATLLADAALAAYRDPGFRGRRPDCVVPVPLTPRRLAARGHNQALTLALPVARRLGVPLYRRALRRMRAAPAQRGLGRRERQHNLDGVFALRGDFSALADRIARQPAAAGAAGTEPAAAETTEVEAPGIRMPGAGPCIVVVDDVITTGATGNAVARVLLAAGAGEVHLLAAARTPRSC